MKVPFFALMFSVTIIAAAQDGSTDLTLGLGGKIVTKIGSSDDYVKGMAVQADGKIILAGTYFAPGLITRIAMTRHLATGGLDLTFSGDGIVTTAIGAENDNGNAVALQQDGKIIVAGTSTTSDTTKMLVVRYNTDGTPDNTFDGDGSMRVLVGEKYNDVTTVAMQPDGKILIGGKAFLKDTTRLVLLRLNANGSLDASFDGDGIVMTAAPAAFATVTKVLLQPDGKIVAAGSVYKTDKGEFIVARYQANGAPDTEFDGDGLLAVPTALDYTGRSAALQADGKIILAGYYYQSANYNFALHRYNGNGTPDNSFSGDGIVLTEVGGDYDFLNDITLQQDGKIVAVGNSFNGTNYDIGVVRYLSNGELDASFDGDGKRLIPMSSGGDFGDAAAMQSDGKILIGGGVTVGAGELDFILIRLNSTLVTGVDETLSGAPSEFELQQNYPNPFNPSTTIGFTLHTSDLTSLKIYDAIGREVAVLVNEHLDAGTYHQRTFDASRLASGLYFVRLSSGDKKSMKKMLLVK